MSNSALEPIDAELVFYPGALAAQRPVGCRIEELAGAAFSSSAGRGFLTMHPCRRTIYFDYNATTPLDPAVRDAMLPFLGDVWGNPSSVHHVGRKARALLDDARDRAAKFLGAKPSEIIFTSGGTESNNLAIFGAARSLKSKGKHLITSAIEHHAVLHCFDYLGEKGGL